MRSIIEVPLLIVSRYDGRAPLRVRAGDAARDGLRAADREGGLVWGRVRLVEEGGARRVAHTVRAGMRAAVERPSAARRLDRCPGIGLAPPRSAIVAGT